MMDYRDFPEAEKGRVWMYPLPEWLQSPYNPDNFVKYNDWVLKMAGKGYMVEFFEYNGSTIPYSYALLKPMEDVAEVDL